MFAAQLPLQCFLAQSTSDFRICLLASVPFHVFDAIYLHGFVGLPLSVL
jgi:hypothetical protein